MKTIYVLVESYPNLDGERKMNYVHTRNKKYVSKGFIVQVISFTANKDYVIDGIHVTNSEDLEQKISKGVPSNSILISHAPNLRHHYKILKKYKKYFDKVILFFHGHEILYINNYYPKPYKYMENRLKRLFQNLYDYIKLHVWKRYLIDSSNVYSIFVSNWLASEVINNFNLNKRQNIEFQVINNSVGEFFEVNSYKPNNSIEYDFITVRNNFDQSNYCMDLIYDLAINNSNFNFLVIGKGQFFNYYKKPNNIILIDKELTHNELSKYINRSKVALMPTCQDTQGVMTCELATFGIPTITSKLPITKEIFSSFDNVYLIENNFDEYNKFIRKSISLQRASQKNTLYFATNTIRKECDFFREGENYN